MPTATFVKYNALTENLAEKVHNLGADSLKYTLTNTTPNVATHAVLADISELVSGQLALVSGRVPTIVSSAQTSGTYKLVLADITLTVSGGSVGPFRYIVLYNDTPTSPADPLIAYADYGSSITLNDTESIVLDTDQVNGALQLA
jgi:hypothetical protein